MGKNWSAISNIGNPNLRIAFAQIPADSDLAKFLATAFPTCYTDGEDEGPIPLSVIARRAWELGGQSDYLNEEACNELKVPFLRYSLEESNFQQYPDLMTGLLSKEYQDKHKISFGATIPIDDHDYVVVYCSDEEIAIVPIERIIPDATNRRAAIAA